MPKLARTAEQTYTDDAFWRHGGIRVVDKIDTIIVERSRCSPLGYTLVVEIYGIGKHDAR